MKHLPEETQDAVRQLAKGATVGMVSSALEKKALAKNQVMKFFESPNE